MTSDSKKRFYEKNPDYNRRYYLAHKDRYQGAYSQDKHLQRKYGITLEDYRRMLEVQSGLCRICGTSEPGGKNRKFHVDHDHRSGVVRGLLCNNCNLMIGHAKDKPEVLVAAARYLTEALRR